MRNKRAAKCEYRCKVCGAQCQNHVKEMETNRYIGDSESAKKVSGRGLGKWECPNCGRNVKVVRVRSVEQAQKEAA